MKIGLISQWYAPEPGAAAHPAAIANALRQQGHDIRVLTGYPNYPTGALYPGYKNRLRQFETVDGVDVIRVPLIPNHDASATRRAAGLGSFALSASIQVARLRDADVCLVYLTPATVGAAGWLLKRIARVPYVLYVQDLWPDSVMASGFINNSRVASMLEASINHFCRVLYTNSDAVLAISPTMREQLVARGVPPHRCHVVYNWVNEEVFRPTRPILSQERTLDPASSWIMYAGGIGDLQDLRTAVHALHILKNRSDIKLALVGTGVAVNDILALADSLGVTDRVRYLGARTMDEMPGVMHEAVAQLVSLKDMPLFRGTIPSKVQSIMASGLPIISAVPGDASSLIEEARAGLAVSPESPNQLATAFETMVDLPPEEREAMGRRGSAYYNEHFASSVGAARMADILKAASVPARATG